MIRLMSEYREKWLTYTGQLASFITDFILHKFFGFLNFKFNEFYNIIKQDLSSDRDHALQVTELCMP
jgi:hypothetical protein